MRFVEIKGEARRVVLVAPHIRLGVGRRNQLYPVPQLAELARPIIRRAHASIPIRHGGSWAK